MACRATAQSPRRATCSTSPSWPRQAMPSGDHQKSLLPRPPGDPACMLTHSTRTPTVPARDVVGLQASPKLQSSSGFGHREAPPLEGSRVSSVHSVNSALVFPRNAVPTCTCSVSCSGGARSCGLLRVVSCDWSCAGATANCSDKCPAARRHSLSGIWRRRQSRPSGLSLCGRRAEGLIRCMCC